MNKKIHTRKGVKRWHRSLGTLTPGVTGRLCAKVSAGLKSHPEIKRLKCTIPQCKN